MTYSYLSACEPKCRCSHKIKYFFGKRFHICEKKRYFVSQIV